ncbi:MAG: hypothetical protein EXR98_11120 [Gemmataceae bacterium]|nr:hypothetical protein [Gemmataceae bacterium]
MYADEILILEDKKPDLRGIITKAEKGEGLLGTFLIEEKGGKPYEKVYAHVTKDTRIFKLDGKDRKAATFEDLKIGVRVEAISSGKFTKKDPPQTKAVEIVILPAEMK